MILVMRKINCKAIISYLAKDKFQNGNGALIRLAVKAKVSPTLIRSLVTDKYWSKPKHDTVLNLSEAIGISFDEFYPEINDDEVA